MVAEHGYMLHFKEEELCRYEEKTRLNADRTV